MKIENIVRITGTLGTNIFEGYNINQISKRSGVDVATTYRTLKQMEKRNEVIKNRKGNNLFYRLNLRNSTALKYCELTSIENRKKLLSRHTDISEDILRLREKADSIVIFGSVARNEQRPKDVDTLLLFEKKPRIKEIQKSLPLNFSAIYMEFQEFGKKIAGRENLVMEILKDGVVIAGENKYWETVRDAV